MLAYTRRIIFHILKHWSSLSESLQNNLDLDKIVTIVKVIASHVSIEEA